MKIGAPRETVANEERVALVPETVGRLSRAGHELIIESGAGERAGYTDEATVPGFAHARIDPLSDEMVRTFLTRWCEALYADNRTAAEEHCGQLLEAAQAEPAVSYRGGRRSGRTLA